MVVPMLHPIKLHLYLENIKKKHLICYTSKSGQTLKLGCFQLTAFKINKIFGDTLLSHELKDTTFWNAVKIAAEHNRNLFWIQIKFSHSISMNIFNEQHEESHL